MAQEPAGAWNAGLYDDKHAFVWKHGAPLIDLLAPGPGQRVLDVGCGTGHLTARIAQSGASVLGIDQSAEMIEQARHNYPELTFELADCRHLHYDRQFDAVFSNAVLHWVPEAEMAARGIAAALRPGGRMVAEFGGCGNVQSIVSAAHEALQSMGLKPPQLPWYFPSIGQYATVLEQAGLEVTMASLVDRPTPLEGAAGLRNWLQMFGRHWLNCVPGDRSDEFFQRVEDLARPMLYRDGAWVADYRRLVIVAQRRHG